MVTGRQRVWLSGWEWACCGEPFSIGDETTLAVSHGVDDWLITLLGAEVADEIDAVESHHDEPGTERLTGVVRGVSVVSVPHRVRRLKRDTAPGVREERGDPPGMGYGNGLAFGNRSEYTTTSEPIPGTPTIIATTRVPPPAGRAPEAGSHEPPSGGSSDDLVENRVVGYLVEIDVPA